MTTVYQFEDGKIIFVAHEGQLKLVNVVHEDKDIANEVADYLITSLRGLAQSG